jgi:hypothetical protein
MFKSLKTIPQLCEEFKKNAVAQFEQNKQDVTVEIKELESFFSYNADHFESTWIPKQIREDLLKIGVKLSKQRGRTFVVVTIKEKKKKEEKIEKENEEEKGKKKNEKKSNNSK